LGNILGGIIAQRKMGRCMGRESEEGGRGSIKSLLFSSLLFFYHS
jgi:hypothetical protein